MKSIKGLLANYRAYLNKDENGFINYPGELLYLISLLWLLVKTCDGNNKSNISICRNIFSLEELKQYYEES